MHSLIYVHPHNVLQPGLRFKALKELKVPLTLYGFVPYNSTVCPVSSVQPVNSCVLTLVHRLAGESGSG